METVDCVAFLLLDGDRFLVERRKSNRKVAPGAISVPGGHLEAGEGPMEALRREMREELGVNLGEAQFICTLLHRSEELRKLHYYAVSAWSGEIENHEAEALLWLRFDERDRLDLVVDHVALREYQRIFNPD